MVLDFILKFSKSLLKFLHFNFDQVSETLKLFIAFYFPFCLCFFDNLIFKQLSLFLYFSVIIFFVLFIKILLISYFLYRKSPRSLNLFIHLWFNEQSFPGEIVNKTTFKFSIFLIIFLLILTFIIRRCAFPIWRCAFSIWRCLQLSLSVFSFFFFTLIFFFLVFIFVLTPRQKWFILLLCTLFWRYWF